MTTASISINPAIVTNAAGTFYTSSEGYVQGTVLNDPAVRYQLAAGIVSPSASAPMWGGMAITESLPTAGTEASSVTSVLALATALANLTGWTVFDQSSAMISSAQSPVPLSGAGGAINFYRTGSRARIAVACSSAVAASLAGGVVNPTVYWDYTNQVLATSGTGALAVKVVAVDKVGNSQIVNYNSGGSNETLSSGFILIPGAAAWTYNGYIAVIEI
jgi:hypothetical protein